MLDLFNPWVGTHTFTFDVADFRERIGYKVNVVRNQMEVGNEAIYFANILLADLEGAFIEETSKALNTLYMRGQSNEEMTMSESANHIVTFENYIQKQHTQNYDIHKELDMVTVDMLGRRPHF